LGVYQLERDSLKIYFGREDERPAKISATPVWDLERVSRKPAQIPQRFANAPGCFWFDEPSGGPSPFASMGAPTRAFAYIYEKRADGAVFITLAGSGSRPTSRR